MMTTLLFSLKQFFLAIVMLAKYLASTVFLVSFSLVSACVDEQQK